MEKKNGEKWINGKEIMTLIVATNGIASRQPERQQTGTPHARANEKIMLKEKLIKSLLQKIKPRTILLLKLICKTRQKILFRLYISLKIKSLWSKTIYSDRHNTLTSGLIHMLGEEG